MSWSVADARSHLSTVIAAAGGEPQVIESRGQAVAVVVGVEAYGAFERWRREHPTRTMAEAIEEVRLICAEDAYTLDPEPRDTRANPFAEALDGLDR